VKTALAILGFVAIVAKYWWLALLLLLLVWFLIGAKQK
jgi:hypothetical protein